MKTLPQVPRPILPVLLLLLLPFLAGLPLRGEESGEAKRRLRAAEKEIEELRDDLHEAHRELASKSERIEILEKELQVLRNRKPGSDARKPASRESKPEVNEAARKPAREMKAAPSKREKATPSFVVQYEAKSAVNYEGREEALVWVKSRLKQSPGARLILTGWANDTEYPETNREVAENRARYLADYLELSGISRECLVVETSRGSREGEAGRQVHILLAKP